MHILIWLYGLLSLLDPVFDFATCAARVCYLFIPYPELQKSHTRDREKWGNIMLWWEIIHIEWFERIILRSEVIIFQQDSSYLVGGVKLIRLLASAIRRAAPEEPRHWVHHANWGVDYTKFQSIHTLKLGGMCYRHKLTWLINGPRASWA